MFAASRLASQALLVRNAVTQTRNMSVISGPPTVKISNTEKILHGVAITVGLLTVPAWVLVNIKNYRSHE